MNTRIALHALGVREDTLSPEEKAKLDQDGYLPLEGVLSPSQVAYFRSRLDEIAEADGEQVGPDGHMVNLMDRDLMFTLPFIHPRVLAAIQHVLQGEMKLLSLNSRSPKQGEGGQGLHADGNIPVSDGRYIFCNSIWLLDDFTETNGPTRVVPGSHRSGKLPRDEMEDPTQPHPDELKVLASAGTVVVFNSHLWHGGTKNETGETRHAMHSCFGRRDQGQWTDFTASISPEAYARLGEPARYLLDI